MTYSIAIDGPAGAGKSTIAKLLAKDMWFKYVDTGAMFRTVAIACSKYGADPNIEDNVEDICKKVDIRVKYHGDEQRMFVDGEDVTGRLRDELTGKVASIIAVYPCVREKLLNVQRAIAGDENVIMDGRDIGSVVLPDATVKIYLSASAVARGMRRYKELEEKGVEPDLGQIINDIKERDYRDMNREIAPLKIADGAVIVDSSDMTIPEVITKCKEIISRKIK